MQNSINQSNYLYLVEHVMHSKSDNIEITIYNKADEIIQKLLGSSFLKSNYF